MKESVACVSRHPTYLPLGRTPGLHNMDEICTVTTHDQAELEEREKKREQLEEMYVEKKKVKLSWLWPATCLNPLKMLPQKKKPPKPTLPVDLIKIVKTNPLFTMQPDEDSLSMIEPSELSSIEPRSYSIMSGIRKASRRILYGKEDDDSVTPEQSDVVHFEDDFIAFVCGQGVSDKEKSRSWRSFWKKV